MRRLTHISFIVVLLFVGGCSASDDRRLPPVVIHTPLEVDPMDRHEFVGWWSNGTQLLRLQPDASYTLWSTTNRYTPPRERGRWSQRSYAVLRLEAYTRFQREPARVSIVRVDGELALRMPGVEAPFFEIDQPPLVLEDELFGVWRGDAGTLRLHDTMRYQFSPRLPRTDEPLVLAGHEGRWQLYDGVIILRPDAAGVEPIELPLEGERDNRRLLSRSGNFHFQR